jgi:hypothetical protein
MQHAPSYVSATDASQRSFFSDFFFCLDFFYFFPSFFYAACYGHTAAVDLLLEAKAEVDATNEHGWTPLQAR